MKAFKDDKVKGIVGTIVFHAVIVIALVLACLNYSFPPKDNQIAHIRTDEVLFGGEYVMLGDFVTPTPNKVSAPKPVEEVSPKPQVKGEDMSNAGTKGEAAPSLVTGNEESPMKTEVVAEKPGPTKEELEAEAERVKREVAAEKIKNRVSFGSNNNTGSGTTGSPTGVSTSIASSGAPGVSGLEGYTLSSWGRPSSPVQGVVRIKVRVNARGKVLEASYAGGSGSAASNSAVRRSCEEASLKSQFSVPNNTTTEGVGVITWRFE